jgi:hypothetical protein
MLSRLPVGASEDEKPADCVRNIFAALRICRGA